MFSNIKNFLELKKQAEQMKKEMEKIKVTVEHANYEIVMKGDQTVDSVLEDGEENNDLRKLFNKAVKESQKEVAKKMRGQFGNMGIPGL